MRFDPWTFKMWSGTTETFHITDREVAVGGPGVWCCFMSIITFLRRSKYIKHFSVSFGSSAGSWWNDVKLHLWQLWRVWQCIHWLAARVCDGYGHCLCHFCDVTPFILADASGTLVPRNTFQLLSALYSNFVPIIVKARYFSVADFECFWTLHFILVTERTEFYQVLCKGKSVPLQARGAQKVAGS